MPLIKSLFGITELPKCGANMDTTLEKFVTSDRTTAASLIHPGGDDAQTYAEGLENVLKAIHETHAPAPTSGLQLLQQLEQSRLIPTGCPSVDTQLLRGGLREGQITEVCGETASGKTQLCLMAAAHTAARGERVVYIDTSNAFTASRLMRMLRAVTQARVAVDDALARITVHRAYDIHAVLTALDGILQQQQQQQQPRLALVVVDSLSAVIAPVLGGGGGGGQRSMGHALLASAAASLKGVALRLGAAVVVTNHMVGGGEGGRGDLRPAMGESWKSQPHVRILLSPSGASGSATGPVLAGGSSPHTATLAASTFCPRGSQAPYWLGPAGLVHQPPTPSAIAHVGAGGR